MFVSSPNSDIPAHSFIIYQKNIIIANKTSYMAAERERLAHYFNMHLFPNPSYLKYGPLNITDTWNFNHNYWK